MTSETPVNGGRKELEVLGTTRLRSADEGELIEVELRVPPDLLYFSGHFPEDPVLPGVVQLSDIAIGQVERLWPELGRLVGIRRLKFIHVIAPGDTVTARLERRPKPGQVGLAILKGETICSSGILTFEVEGSL